MEENKTNNEKKDLNVNVEIKAIRLVREKCPCCGINIYNVPVAYGDYRRCQKCGTEWTV